jgi:hypothetical protein
MSDMRAADFRAFVERSRSAAGRLKREHWAAVAASGHADPVPLGHLLLEHALAANPAYPTESQRREDYEHHLRLEQLFRRAEAAFQSR